MSFYTSDRFQIPTFSNCPRCQQTVSSTCNYCPNCGASLKQTAPNYTADRVKIPLDRDYFNPPNINIDPSKINIKPPKINIDSPIGSSANFSNIAMSGEFCSQCGQRINRSQPLDNNIYDLNRRNSSVCFIATACNADTGTLDTFYKFRDEILLHSSIGRKAVQLYYRFSPRVAKRIQKSKLLQHSILSVLLKPLAALLRFSVLGAKDEVWHED